MPVHFSVNGDRCQDLIYILLTGVAQGNFEVSTVNKNGDTILNFTGFTVKGWLFSSIPVKSGHKYRVMLIRMKKRVFTE
jgi:hypothetical protein